MLGSTRVPLREETASMIPTISNDQHASLAQSQTTQHQLQADQHLERLSERW